MSSINEPENISIPTPIQSTGCFRTILIIIFGIVLLSITTTFLTAEWLFEQALFEGSLGLPDLRPHIGTLLILGLFFFIGIFSLFRRKFNLSEICKTWLWAASLSVFGLAIRFLNITNWQGAISVGIAALSVFIMINAGGLSKLKTRFTKIGMGNSTSFAGILAAMMWIPWVIWGSLGSLFDTVLGLVFGILFALAAVLLVEPWLISSQGPKTGTSKPFLNIFVIFVAWAMMAAAITPVGMQAFIAPLAGLTTILAFGFYQQGSTDFAPFLGVITVLAAVVSAPLIWLDGDEMMVVIGSSTGDLFSYAFRMLGITLLLLVVAGIFSLVCKVEVRRWFSSSLNIQWIPLIAWLFVMAVYFGWGQPGFYGDQLFVILNDQIDFQQVNLSIDPAERRAQVYKMTASHAEQSQSNLVHQFDNLNIQYHSFYLENAIEVRGGPLVKAWLKTKPEVDRVLDSPHLRPLNGTLIQVTGTSSKPDQIPWNIKMINADDVWEQFGVRGAGIIIGQSDSGVQGSHPQLADSYAGKQNDQYAWLDPWFGTPSPTDWVGHGTHTLGSILGNEIGVAPDAKWIGCVNLGRNLGNPAYYLTCMQFMLAPYPQDGNSMSDGDPSKGANIMNNSWGCPSVEGCDPDTFEPALEALKAAGIFVVASAGNSGYAGCGSVDTPIALNSEVFTVGAVDQKADLTAFSSIGPVVVDGSNRAKPELLAPGDMVLSSYPGDTYEIASGTSMAGPHVAGVVALMWSANPNLIGNIDLTSQILVETARFYKGPIPDCIQGSTATDTQAFIGYGIVDAFQAVQAAIKVK